jgi:hypothetical protein
MQIKYPLAQTFSATVAAISQRLSVVEKKIQNLQGVGGSTPLTLPNPLVVPEVTLTGPSPGTPSTGQAAIYANANGTPSVVSDSGMAGQLPTTQAIRNLHSVSNATSMTSFTDTWIIPAGDAAPQTCYRIKASGTGTYSSGSVNFQILSFGAASSGVTFTAMPSSFGWSAEGIMTVATTTTGFSTLTVWVSPNATPATGFGCSGGISSPANQTLTTGVTSMVLQVDETATAAIFCYMSSFERLSA